MAGFIRRYGYFPGTETISLIEGVVIVDLPPPGSISGVSSGVVGMVGEFADHTYAVKVNSDGTITTSPRPVEVFSAQDMANKVGGWDATIGDFGSSMGNGFVAVRNKQYARLIVSPVNLASLRGGRMYRKLPSNISATNPSPVVPMQAATVPASTMFRVGSDRILSARRVSFAGDLQYAQGTDGVVTPAGLPAATQSFVSAGADFVGAGVAVGDAIVIDVLPGDATSVTDNPMLIGALTANVASTSGFPAAGVIKIGSEYITYTGTTATSFTGLGRGALGSAAAAHSQGSSVTLVNSADTYRVNAVVNATTLTLERQDGSNFTQTNWIAGTALPYRLHPGLCADSALGLNSADGSYTVACRPLDASVLPSTLMPPQTVPPAATKMTWNVLSGLGMLSTSNINGIVHTPAIQAPNAVASSELDALYASAIDALQSQQLPAREVTILDVARTSATIRALQRAHVLAVSQFGLGRITAVWPEVDQIDPTTVLGDASPGVGATRDERVIYSWPACTTYVPEAVGHSLMGADGALYANGVVDVPGAGWLVAVMSNLAPERNPGQAGPPVPTVMAPVSGIQRGLAVELTMNDYIQFRQKGICGVRIDRTSGAIFQSGITSSLTAGQKNINRRRMADFIEDSLAQRLNQFSKLPLTTSLKDSAEAEVNAFMSSLLSPNNPSAQRISDYSVDPRSGNTPELEAQGIFVIVVNVRTLASADFIVIQANIGEAVVITR